MGIIQQSFHDGNRPFNAPQLTGNRRLPIGTANRFFLLFPGGQVYSGAALRLCDSGVFGHGFCAEFHLQAAPPTAGVPAA